MGGLGPIDGQDLAGQTGPAQLGESHGGESLSIRPTDPLVAHLVLDTGPLILATTTSSLFSPLTHPSTKLYTVPGVLHELKDEASRTAFSTSLVKSRLQIREAGVEARVKVREVAKQTGDLASLSAVDLQILALAWEIHQETKVVDEGLERLSVSEEAQAEDAQNEGAIEHQVVQDAPDTRTSDLPNSQQDPVEDQDDDDEEGGWITPKNIEKHRAKSLGHLSDTSKAVPTSGPILAACTTTDFAVQNILMTLGIPLVSVDGKQIKKIKTWVLRCHACFTITTDSSKRFCHSCGGPTLIRTSVTVKDNGTKELRADGRPRANLQIHLKKNFQYNLRGTQYSIPHPKAGSAKQGPSSNLILREDQPEFMRAQQRQAREEKKEERRLNRELLASTNTSKGPTWDQDEMPSLYRLQSETKSNFAGAGLPVVGHGRKNPNAVRRRTGR